MTLDRIHGQNLLRQLNEDPEFTLQIRELTGRIRFVEADVPAFILHFVEGTAARVDDSPTPFDPFDIQLAGTSEHWSKLLSAAPEAFYQDWFPAMFHHGFRLEGNIEMAMAYYPALVRLRQILAGSLERQETA